MYNQYLPDNQQDADEVPSQKEWERYDKACPNCGSWDTWILEIDEEHNRIECDDCDFSKEI